MPPSSLAYILSSIPNRSNFVDFGIIYNLGTNVYMIHLLMQYLF